MSKLDCIKLLKDLIDESKGNGMTREVLALQDVITLLQKIRKEEDIARNHD